MIFFFFYGKCFFLFEKKIKKDGKKEKKKKIKKGVKYIDMNNLDNDFYLSILNDIK